MDYRLEILDEHTFENLVNTICQKILGTGVVSFSEGKDGGRDGRFEGTAQKYPSETDNWKGKFIIQSKHTSSPIASCADSEFIKQIIKIEIPKLKILKLKNEIENYLLFTNRKYSAIKGEELRNIIKEEVGIQNVAIIGKETINNLYLNSNKEIIKQYGLHHFQIPFDFSDEEIKEIILAFKSQLPGIEEELRSEVNRIKYEFDLIGKVEKNIKNRLNEDYYRDEIASKSLMEFDKLDQFLNNPINSEFKDYYFDTAFELNQIISLKRDDFDGFEELFVFIYKKICDGERKLKGAKRYVTVLLHYMYFECLIGKK